MYRTDSSPLDLDSIRERNRKAVAEAQDALMDGRPDLTVRDEANAIVANVVRNNVFFENLHAGYSSPLLRDASLSRFTDDEMKKLMIEMSARMAYVLHLRAGDPDAYFALIDWSRDSYCRDWERRATSWDLPSASAADFPVCPCGTSLYNAGWRFCPACGMPVPKRA